MLGIKIEILFEEDDPDGSECNSCKKPITEGTKWVMMMQTGPVIEAPKVMDIFYCDECKKKWDCA
jgi:hypothetical protein